MNTMNNDQLDEIVGGADSLPRDIGQFIGGVNGWLQTNFATYLLLGPGFGSLAAINAGIRNAEL